MAAAVNRLTARSVWAGTFSATGSLTASAPGLIVTAARPPKVTGRLVPAVTAPPPADRPMSTWRNVIGWAPKTFERRIRADRPPALDQTTFRMVWSLNPAEEKSVAEVRLGGVAAIGLAKRREQCFNTAEGTKDSMPTTCSIPKPSGSFARVVSRAHTT